MSVIAARVFVGGAATALLTSVVWLALIVGGSGSHPGTTVTLAVIAVLSGTALLVGATLVARFVDASIERDVLVVRSALRPRRAVALADIEEVVVIESLLLPARTAGSVRRLVIRTRAGGVIGITARNAGLVAQLGARAVPITVDSEPLAPGTAARRHPGASSWAERILGAMLWAAVIVPVIVVIWLLVSR